MAKLAQGQRHLRIRQSLVRIATLSSYIANKNPFAMADGRQEPYDPYLPSTGNAQGGNARTAALQAVSKLLQEVICSHPRGIRERSGTSSERKEKLRRAGD